MAIKHGGTGIPDIEQAMRPGFSRAPRWAPGLGFGTGMGMPTIQAYADGVKLQSRVGLGTYLEIVIYTW